MADFSGFQFLRDNDPTNMGHNTDFVTIIADNILNILDSSQIQKFVASAKVEADLINNPIGIAFLVQARISTQPR